MILFFTGTGNSRYIAEKIAKKTCDDMICINDRIKQNDTSSIRVSGDLSIVTPTYAWRIPNLLKEWLLQTKKQLVVSIICKNHTVLYEGFLHRMRKMCVLMSVARNDAIKVNIF